ncbi:3-deoxy-7-phosphoheptulonate synthase AroG [Aliikangiella sp. G2MR2-5]|uniref:3-deoxy-7-phosphoheptulonate synthase AroG n=1 Tax=Aliikangiella sp. G2MR2-5 TaxID=2788943 RepID=UPI0018A947E9|nr:3-deoxy-7-phosphoheptulonate synthase AroG [Aliikangiella sp. G2MR2-5]
MIYPTDDLRIEKIKELLPPIALMEKYPLNSAAEKTVVEGRNAVSQILRGESQKLLVIVGPCSIHDPEAALVYARKLSEVRKKYQNNLEIVMRVYFEKPRTTVGWKGLINDPHLNNSFKINEGLRLARKLLVDINELGLPTAGEFLDMITPQYIADLMSWGAIGARTTESQVHRELASGLSCPVGFKNGTDGNIKIAVDAIRAASSPHHFLSVTKYGHSAIVETAGNEDCHIILRGGKEPNYDLESINSVSEQLGEAKLNSKVMVDFSHANSLKEFKRQLDVCESVSKQIKNGSQNIFGVMIESFLEEGNQSLVDGKAPVFGQSITDGCIGWEDTELVLAKLNDAIEETA